VHWLERHAFEELIDGIELYGICTMNEIDEYKITSGIDTFDVRRDAVAFNYSYAMIGIFRKNLWLHCDRRIPILRFEITVYSAEKRKYHHMVEDIHHIPSESSSIIGIEQLLHPFYTFLDTWRITPLADVIISWASEALLDIRIAAGLWDRLHGYTKYVPRVFWYPPNFGELGAIKYDEEGNPELVPLTCALLP